MELITKQEYEYIHKLMESDYKNTKFLFPENKPEHEFVRAFYKEKINTILIKLQLIMGESK